MRSSYVWLALAIAAGCGDKGPPPMILGEPLHVKLLISGSEIGIDVSLRVPSTYRAQDMGTRWAFHGHGRDPDIALDIGSASAGSFESPCGTPSLAGDRTLATPYRAEHPDGLTIGCEVRAADGSPLRFWVSRLVRNIDTTVVCTVGLLSETTASQAHRDAAIAVCDSMKVLGRSFYERQAARRISPAGDAGLPQDAP